MSPHQGGEAPSAAAGTPVPAPAAGTSGAAGGRGTRRRLLAGGAAALAIPLVAASPARAALGADAAVLTRVARTELALHDAYARTAAAGTGRVAAVAAAFTAQEAEHLGALATCLEALGAPKPAGPRTPADLDRAVAALGVTPGWTARTGAADRLDLLLALERTGMRTLEDAAARLDDPDLRRTALTILGCQAQHAAVLEALLGHGPVPPGSVEG